MIVPFCASTLPDIRARLEPPAPEVDLLEALDVDVEVIADAARAREVLEGLGPGPLGFDIETAPTARQRRWPPWIRITKAGRRAEHQPKHRTAPASTRHARARGSPRSTIRPLRPSTSSTSPHVPAEVLRPLERRPLIIHNATFEHVDA